MTVRRDADPPSGEFGTSVETAYRALRQQIVDGAIAPETRINIEAVARTLGVSPTPIREALRMLEKEELVVHSAGRGYRTTPVLHPEALTQIFEFRLLVEPWAARAAAAGRLTNPGRELAAELVSFEQQIDSGSDVRQAMLVHDTRFHEIVVRSAGNDVAWQAYAQTHCHLHLFRVGRVDLSGQETLAEHGAIADAIGRFDTDGAETAMVAHIRGSYERSIRPLLEATRGRVRAIRADESSITSAFGG